MEALPTLRPLIPTAATTMSGLVAAINAGAAGSTVTAFATNSTTFTITNDVGSDTQMTKGTIGGTSNGSAALTISTADTTNGSDGNKIQSAQQLSSEWVQLQLKRLL